MQVKHTLMISECGSKFASTCIWACEYSQSLSESPLSMRVISVTRHWAHEFSQSLVIQLAITHSHSRVLVVTRHWTREYSQFLTIELASTCNFPQWNSLWISWVFTQANVGQLIIEAHYVISIAVLHVLVNRMIHQFVSNTNVVQRQVYKCLLVVPAARKQHPQTCELLQAGTALLMLLNLWALTNTLCVQ